MKIDRDVIAAGPVIAGFSGTGFRIDENVYVGLLITPERADGWDAPPMVDLTADHVAPLTGVARAPEFILLGTGPTMLRPPRGFVAALEAQGIGVEAMDSRAAARAWGVLRAEGRWIAGALYPLG